MINWTNPDVELTVAKYTKLFKDVTQEELAPLNVDINTWETNLANFGVEPGQLMNHIYNTFRYYEICDNDVSVFVQCMKDVFDNWENEYSQLIKMYYNDMDLDDILKRQVSRADTSDGTNAVNESSSENNTVREYDLPNSQVSPTSEDGYLTGKRKGDHGSQSAAQEARHNEYASSIITTDNREFISLKVQYLNHIRDMLHEFAQKFEDCFLHIY